VEVSRGEGGHGPFRGLAAPFASTGRKDTLLKMGIKENLTGTPTRWSFKVVSLTRDRLPWHLCI